MDFARWGLSARPFRSSPDTKFFTPTPTHDAALDALNESLAGGETMALVDGEAGLGKTITALKFLESLDASVPRLFIPSARFNTASELFQTILFDAELPYQGQSEHELRLAVTDFLLKRMPSDYPMVIVLDEAQHLNADLLEELRLLGNLGSRATRAVFTVLVALPSLRERLAKAEFAALSQRFASRVRLEPLSVEETADYITAQLRQAGDKKGRVLSDEALTLASEACLGIPRRIHQVLTVAFHLAQQAGEKQIDAEAMLAGLTQLGLVVEDTLDDLPIRPLPQDTPRPKAHRPAEFAVPTAESRSKPAVKKRKAS
jgi:type II secretory pathway predicted ATPase ExeA